MRGARLGGSTATTRVALTRGTPPSISRRRAGCRRQRRRHGRHRRRVTRARARFGRVRPGVAGDETCLFARSHASCISKKVGSMKVCEMRFPIFMRPVPCRLVSSRLVSSRSSSVAALSFKAHSPSRGGGSGFDVSFCSREYARILVPRAAVRARPLQHLEVAVIRRERARYVRDILQISSLGSPQTFPGAIPGASREQVVSIGEYIF